MGKVDNIRNDLIGKILAIRDKDFLVALDKLISSSSANSKKISLTTEQELMIQMSLDDLKNGRIISQDSLISKTEEWLKKKMD